MASNSYGAGVSNPGYNISYSIRLDVSTNNDPGANTSSVNFTLYLIKNNFAAWNLDLVTTAVVTINGADYANTFRYDFRNYSSLIIAQGTTSAIGHNGNGTQAISVRGRFSGPGPLTGGDTGFQTFTFDDYNRSPSAPSRPSLSSRNRQSITMTTSASVPSGAPGVSSYTWQVSTDASSWSTVSGSGSTLSYTAPSATTPYYFRALATSSEGSSGYSAASLVVPGAPNTPSAPTLQPNLQNSGSSMLVTSAVPANNGAGITAYQYRYMPSDGSFTEAASSAQNNWEFAIPNNLKHYLISTRAFNSSGWSDWSNTSAGIPGRPSTITTDTPVGLKATVFAGQSVSTPAITEYYVSASKDNGATWEAEIPMGLDREYQYVGLSGGKNYLFRVRSFNAIGASAYTILDPAVFVPAGGKRWTGDGFVPTATVKRRVSDGWETVTIAKRWTGNSWEVLT